MASCQLNAHVVEPNGTEDSSKNKEYLQGYEKSLEEHLRNILFNVDDELKKMNLLLKEANATEINLTNENSRFRQETKKLRAKSRQQNFAVENLTKGQNRLIEKHNRAENQLFQHNNELKQRLLGEREVCGELSLLGDNIAKTLATLDAIAWPEKNDMKLLRRIIGREANHVMEFEKEKRLQDAYLERLKKDIQLAEEKMERLTQTTKIIKIEECNSDRRFVNFYNRLKTFETGDLRMEDNWQQLCAALYSENNKIKFMKDTNNNGENNVTEKPRSPLFASSIRTAPENIHLECVYSTAKEMLTEQEKKLGKQNIELIQLHGLIECHSKTNILQQLNQVNIINETLLHKTNELAKVYKDLLIEKGIDPDQFMRVGMISEEDNFEFKFHSNMKQIEFYTNALGEFRLQLIDNNQILNQMTHQPINKGKTYLELYQYNNEINQSYPLLRRAITELIRKKIALTYKKERMTVMALNLSKKFKEVRQEAELTTREFRTLFSEAFHFDHATQAFEIDETNKTNNLWWSKRRNELQKHADELLFRKQRLTIDIEWLSKRLNMIKFKSKEWQLNKLEKIWTLSDKQRLEMLNEIYSFKKMNQTLEMKIWKIRKQLEFVVMHRNYAVHKLQATVLGSFKHT